jgi:tRNA nucleotidyltransferase (CCA-adding enzyme)
MAPAGHGPDLAAAIPPAVRTHIDTLRANGFAAYAVGGALRDAIRGVDAHDWDLASSAAPEQVQALFPGSVYENAFGTVALRVAGLAEPLQITTFRQDHDYADFRRPHRVVFGGTIEVDLARRDFTMNAIAWGGPAGVDAEPGLVDPYAGGVDIQAHRIRAVGEPAARFREDALRILRAIRFATTLGFEIEPATLAAIREHAPLTAHLSGERVLAELERLLLAPSPSVGLRLLADTGVLAVLVPELDAQRGIPQNKIPGEDLWAHTLRTVDASAATPGVRLAALLHDIGKPATLADGRFVGHDIVGAAIATELLDRLHGSRERTEHVSRLIRHHMFSVEPRSSDAAVRRFLVRVGLDLVEDLLLLREADNVGSGLPADAGRVSALRRRIAEQLEAKVALDRTQLAVDGNEVMRELGIEPGPQLGRILEALTDRVIADPRLNDRPRLLSLARDIAAGRR